MSCCYNGRHGKKVKIKCKRIIIEEKGHGVSETEIREHKGLEEVEESDGVVFCTSKKYMNDNERNITDRTRWPIYIV